MRVLIISPEPWRKDNSFGNSYSSIFGKLNNIEIAHIYFLDGEPDYEPNVKRYYKISESEVMASVLLFWKKKVGAGCEILLSQKSDSFHSSVTKRSEQSLYKRLLSFGKRKHWSVLFNAREIAWRFGKINYDGMMGFVNDFKPDIIFLPYYHTYYTNRLAHYIKSRLDIPMVLEMAMDHYSLKRVSINVFFWVERFMKRAMIRKLVKESEMVFVISKKLKEEMERDLNIPCHILYKIPDESRAYHTYTTNNNGCIKYLFTGNIYANRWRSLAMLAEEIKRQGGGKLDIYTATPLTKEMDRALNISGVSEVHSPVSSEEIIILQNGADVLVHAEAFDKFNKSLVRCAISTKIMDYLSAGRCILTIGPSDISSVEYLAENNLALNASSKEQLAEIVRNLNADNTIINCYAERGRAFALKELDPTMMRQALYDDLQSVINNFSHS